ncbi:MAG: formylmethanofuran dehydrogenase subunit E family protein [candidate division WOR-3 bacterium]
MKRLTSLADAARFHGHLGPWLVLGLRAGRHAADKLKVKPFELQARVFCPSGTPYTCLLDGVQLGSGCTMGKGNIRHIRSRRVRIVFQRQARPGSLLLELRPEVWTELHLCATRHRVAAIAHSLFRRPFPALFLERPGT